jgi:hypothetical protein
MSFGTTPISTTSLSTNQFPCSAVYVPNTAGGNFIALAGGPALSADTNGNISAPAMMYLPDGNSIVEGATTDVAVTGDVSGSISAKLRGLNKIFAQLQFDGSNFLKVNVAAGTVAASQSGTWNITNISGTISLPTGAAQDSTVAKLNIAQATALGTNTGPLVQGSVTTSSPTYTTGNINPLSLTTAGALRVDASATTQPVSGTITANAGTGNFTVVQATGSNLHAVLDSGSTTAVTQATASNLNAQVVGSVASGGSNAGNPLKIGGVYNSTQPTVTTGQIVDVQATARGAQIVATGVDAFAVNASQSGTWNITNISGTVSLPTGAATSAKQPALGTAGSASTDVLTVQGIASMTALKVDGSAVTQPVSGTVTANAGTGTFNVQQSNITTDYDTGAGTQTMTMFGMALPASGGAVAGGTSSNPLRIDPTGTTTQPVSGTITANAGTGTFNIQSNASVNVNQVAGSAVSTAATGIMKVGLTDGTGNAITSTTNALDVNIKSGGGSGFSVTDEAAWTAGTSAFTPAGGVFNDTATALTSGQEGTVRLTNNRAIHVNLRDASANQLLGSKTSANSIPVVIASDQGAVTISGTVTANAGTNLNTSALALDTSVNGILLSQGSTTSGQKGSLIQGAVTTNAPSYTTAQTSPLSLDTSGLLRASLKDTPSNTNNLNVNLAASAATVTVSGTVTANIGTSGSLALDATVAKLNVAQAAALGSNTGPMIQGSVTTNAPSYTTGNINPLSLDTSGLLRVSLKDTPANTNNLNVALAASSATVTVTATNLQTNLNQIAGSAISTAATGVQKVGIVGNTGATLDSTVGAGTAPTNAMVTGAIYNSSAPAPTSGQAMALQADQAGNMRIFPGIALAALSAWNSSTSLNATQNIFTNSGTEAVLVQFTQTSTLTAGAITFEVSYDGSTWNTIPANCVLDPTSTTFAQISLPYTVQASTNKAILINSNGMQGLRVKLSTQITGTGTVTPNYALLPNSPADTVVALSPTAANFNTSSVIQVSSGTALTADQSNTILKTSLYVKKSANADTVLALGSATSANSVPVVVASDQGAIPVSQSGTWTVQPGNTANTTAWLVQDVAGTSGGSTASHTMSAASTNANSLKASAGMVYGLSISNANASARYFKLYNKASSPTVGTDTPILTLQVPGNGTVIRAYPVGLVLGTGIAWACTGGIADSDTTAIGANDCSIDIDYK